MIILRKVISGAQTGADQAGLRAAQKAGLETSGHVPLGCRTLDGVEPHLIKKYNLTEMTTSQYAPRTFENVKNSDGTIRLARDFTTSGEQLTLKAIRQYNKPFFDVRVGYTTSSIDRSLDQVLEWLDVNQIQILNIAGNSERSARGIGDVVYGYLIQAFNRILK